MVRKGDRRPLGMLRRLRTEDRMLAVVRGAVFLGAAVWMALAPIEPAVRIRCGVLLGVFAGYGLLIVWTVSRWTEQGRAIYLWALAADLIFMYFLFGATGGISSPFLPAAFLLSVLTAFHYGPVLGVGAAWAAVSLAAASDLSSLAERHWSEFPLLFIFVTLTAAYVGWLARREAEDRRDIERLHEEISERARELEEAYGRCREVQDHLVHSERLATIGRMSAEMAHQVRNPLSSISLNLELLEDEISRAPSVPSSEASWLVTAIYKEIENLTEVTESYLRFAKLPPFHWEEVDLNDIVRGMLIFAKPRIEQQRVKVSRHLDRGLPRVRLDRRQFKFAVMNVLANALEAMSPGGRLRVRTRSNGTGVSLMISDTGEGIPGNAIPKIFDPFFTTKQGGTGLGLSLTRRIIEAHGGRITCESIRQVGTTFTVSLPVDGQAPAERADGEG